MLAIKQGDTRHAIEGTLSKNGTVQDLTDCSVSFFMENGVSSLCNVTDPVNGKVIFVLEAPMVDVPGRYKAEFKVTYPDGRVAHFPNNDYIVLHISKNLEG